MHGEVQREPHTPRIPQCHVHRIGAGRLPPLDAEAAGLATQREDAPRRPENVGGVVRVRGLVSNGLLVGQGAVA